MKQLSKSCNGEMSAIYLEILRIVANDQPLSSQNEELVRLMRCLHVVLDIIVEWSILLLLQTIA